jgi:hypothetical protein
VGGPAEPPRRLETCTPPSGQAAAGGGATAGRALVRWSPGPGTMPPGPPMESLGILRSEVVYTYYIVYAFVRILRLLSAPVLSQSKVCLNVCI